MSFGARLLACWQCGRWGKAAGEALGALVVLVKSSVVPMLCDGVIQRADGVEV